MELVVAMKLINTTIPVTEVLELVHASATSSIGMTWLPRQKRHLPVNENYKKEIREKAKNLIEQNKNSKWYADDKELFVETTAVETIQIEHTVERALESLKEKAAALDADAVIGVTIDKDFYKRGRGQRNRELRMGVRVTVVGTAVVL